MTAREAPSILRLYLLLVLLAGASLLFSYSCSQRSLSALDAPLGSEILLDLFQLLSKIHILKT